MSLHKSLRGKSGLVRHRNVLNRYERMLKLQEEERWTESSSVLGMPKVRSIKMKRKAKGKKTDDAEAGAKPAAKAAAGAKPAAGAAKAADKKK